MVLPGGWLGFGRGLLWFLLWFCLGVGWGFGVLLGFVGGWLESQSCHSVVPSDRRPQRLVGTSWEFNQQAHD